MGNPLQTIQIVRGGAPPSIQPQLGYRIYVPAWSVGDLPLATDGALKALGWPPVERLGTTFKRIDATGLICPTRWERLFVGWVAEQTGAEVEWFQSCELGPIGRALEGEGFADPDALPDGASIRRAATRRGEAKAAIRDIRDAIETAEDCDDVLILLPRSQSLRALWLRELADADLPVRAAHYAPIDTHAISRWVLALAALEQWDTHPVSRYQLRAVLEGKYWRQGALKTGVRGSVRKLLASMRREAFTLREWRRHLTSPGVYREDRERAQLWTKTIWDGTKRGATPFARLASLVVDLGVRQAVAERGDSSATDVCEKVLDVLESLAYTESKLRGAHPLVASLGVMPVLKSALRASWLNQSTRPDHGIRVGSYDQYNGEPSKLLIAAGLGEGDFPYIPNQLDAHQFAWVEALDLLEPFETVQDLVMVEVDRQLALFSQATAAAQNVVLSYASEGTGTEHRHPGPLLSLLVGRWTENVWHEHPKIDVFDWSHEVPQNPSQASSWQDAALFAGDQGFAEWVGTQTSSLPAPDQHRAKELVEGFQSLESTRQAAAERSPRLGESAILGAYGGILPAGIEEPEAYSASALESYGQCGTKYFLGNVLKVRDREDMPDRLDPREVGTLLHRAFSDAARHAIDLAQDELWSMCWHPGESQEDIVDRVSFSVSLRLNDVVSEYLIQQVSLSGALTEAVVARWRPAIKHWIRLHAREWLPATPTQAHYDADATYQKALEKEEKAQGALNTLEILRQRIADGTITTATGAAKAGPTFRGFLTQDQLKTGFKSGVDGVQAEVNVLAGEATQAVEAARNAVDRRFAEYLNPEVAHSELGFGLDAARTQRDADPESQEDPVEISIGDTRIKLRGQVDRVDWDRERSTLAVRDFKSGRSRSRGKLEQQMMSGEHVQLPLYALAIDELTRLGVLEHLKHTHVSQVSLEFPRDPRKNATQLLLDGDASCTVDGQDMTWRSLSEAWIGSHVDHIRQGRFSLLPTSCPIERSGYCDFARSCGYTQGLGKRGVDPRKRPEPQREAKETSSKKKYFPDVIQPVARAFAPDHESLRNDHEAATQASSNTGQDVSISAGAGTGKTYNLVLRYLAALAEGTDPNEILCITFTRRAAGEMKRRVRDALLRESAGPQMQFVESIRADRTRFRRILLELSAAPITTIDALAGEVLRESMAALSAADGQPAITFEICTNDDVKEELETFVSDQFIREFEAQEPHLMALTSELDPIQLRNLLADSCAFAVPEAISKCTTLQERVETISSTWLTAMSRAACAIAEVVELWNIDALHEALEAAKSSAQGMDPKAQELAETALFAVSSLQTSSKPDSLAGWRSIASLFGLPTGITKNKRVWLGRNDFRTAWLERMAELKARFAFDPDRLKAVQGFCGVVTDFEAQASFAARSTFVSQRWEGEFRAYLKNHGKLRFSDVEAMANDFVRDPRVAEHLAARFPLRHIFVDEAQDTSHRQLSFLAGLQELVESNGRVVNTFFVGDLKQSIYAFRGAEVDVFRRRIDKALAEPGHVREKFTINRRSTPSLLDAINGLFSVVFPAQGESQSLDPRSEVPFEGLVAPQGTPDQPAAIELLFARGKGWQGPEPDDLEDEDESPLDFLETTAAQRGLVAKMGELVSAYPPGPDGPQIALLVGSWARAEFLRDLLQAYGLSVAVQGGRGLLTTAEVDSVVQWLEAVTHPNLHTPFLGALRGPGISMSDAGLYCLKQGYGVSLDHPKSIKQVASFGDFDPEVAALEWLGEGHPELAKSTTQLRLDALALERFKDIMKGFFPRVGVDSTSDTLSWLVSQLNLWSFWGATENGRQRIANLRSFLDLVRDLEEATGNDPQQLVRRLAAMRGASDPSAGGLEAGNGAQALITTYWQSKGMEWSVVVLPDLDSTRIRGQSRGLSISRIHLPDVHGKVVYSPEVRQSDDERPLWSETTGMTQVFDQYRKPASRAELRRLLYVAMTRAKHKLVMTATLNAASKENSSGHPKETTLSEAKDWATTLRVALGLHFDDGGLPQVAPGSIWAPLVESGAVVLTDAVAKGEALALTQAPPSSGLSFDSESMSSGDILKRWAVLTREERTYLKPSDHHVDSVPQWDPELSRPLPEIATKRKTAFDNEADSGTAFHALMEATAFMYNQDVEEAALNVLAELRFDEPFEQFSDRVDEIIALYEHVLANPMTRELRAAALDGRLFHEVPVSFASGDKWVNGIIDLVWLDRDQVVHLLDYKSGYRHPTQDEPLTPGLQKHFAQVSLYAEGLKTNGIELGSFGLWYVAGGAVLRWKA